ncbi:hypothetical protein L5M16_07470 [Shewanella sp. SM103]|uniref:Uncharacterized protein n=1 Tax=Shewanella oncorhynchi TaxID=2726434 RepID=A0ABX1KSK5_9GAMM|nr:MULTISPECIES: hypothetical protein [Shewanella]MCU8007171.1 hypothetical protein [Shewanella sp. SM87]MCU8078411.1 hypothetical protein [Shewanella sp. SM103]NLQ24541.1 hypothetical protein [Shewanella oncorhynchi]
MGLPVTVYRWDDAGAPVISSSGKPSEMINVLKKCLVDGYGTKSPLGWSVAFEDAASFKIAFRNSTAQGSGGYFSIRSVTGADTANGVMRMQSAQAMTDIDTFVKSIYFASTKLDTVNTKWIVIGTSRGFYVVFGRNNISTYLLGTNVEPMFFVGDIDTLITNDVDAFKLIMSPYASGDVTATGYNYSMTYMFGSAVSTCALFYNTDGSAGSQLYRWRMPYDVINTVSALTSPTTKFLSQVIIESNNPISLDSAGTIQHCSLKMPSVRGVMPGMLMANANADSSLSWPNFELLNGVSHLKMRCVNNNQMCINAVSWYE